MSNWPQALLAIWLLASVSTGVWLAARPAPGWLILTRKQQRLSSLAFAAAALSEASLLWAGGFFHGVL